ncbi:uncharacterized protein PHACADRAFT_179394 [Phanerochaete carnosa HHB-10118-sp]|uniref:Uncharacterized protein n=1 Tax=Phanerochaete carnosa (strain HHB-10118-sp) TaxID=650164 RepID=K5UHE5_PHACS|nr:uncharacterized protein PHACADRAFT_179394 [Phanerochaete carnosa HHB-10118-sp]EKM48911.1 hypothetical protein PHACADRAFT_179394 [Phanerochaete carnosa HHB-10118-sp]
MPCTDTPDLTTAISAFKTGDAWSVRVMYALLLGGIEGEPSPVFSDTPIAPSLIRAQLEEEFATTIDSTPLSKVNQHRLSFNATAEEIGLIDRTLDRLSPPEEMGELKQLLKTHGPTPYLMK